MRNSKNFHKLMHNNFSISDLNSLSNFIKKNKKNPYFTQGQKVEEFEKKWSRWLGVKYSVFVNSGSSANFITMRILKSLTNESGEIILPAFNWPSDIYSVIANDFKPKFVDIDLSTLSLSEDKILKAINKKTKAIFLTHSQGFCGLTKKILNVVKEKKIYLIEDVCESHGAKFEKKSLGTFGVISNFSFYYAHHMSTIEGGMVCTNNNKIYEMARMIRGHGIVREISSSKYQNQYIKKYKNLSPKFIFLYPGFNFRSNELNAVVGLSQLKFLKKNNLKRSKNLKYFLKKIDKEKYFVDFKLEGNSNYAFPVILKKFSIKNRNKLENLLKKHGVEFRRGSVGGGNQLKQPYLKKYFNERINNKLKNTNHIHDCGYYIGNYPTLENSKIDKIVKILNSLLLS